MEANYISYDHEKSDSRIRDILNSAESFEEVDTIPSRSCLTYSNGFYVKCTALFIDIRGSSKLPENHTRPVLGKIYRAYLSECVAVMNGNANCSEVFINGDCVSGVFNTKWTSDVDSVFATAAQLNSTTQLLNWRLEQKGYSVFRCGIGLAYGRALMLKAGYNGSRVNDVIWMGDVVNEASNLCHDGNRGNRATVQVSTTIYDNLTDHNKSLLRPVGPSIFHAAEKYEGNITWRPSDAYLSSLKDKAEAARRSQNSLASLLYPKGY